VMDAKDFAALHVGEWLHPQDEGYPHEEVTR
jgi:hypothetical protein